MQKILSLPPALLVLSGTIEIEDSEPFAFHRLVAGAAKFLVEDLDQKEAHQASRQWRDICLPAKIGWRQWFSLPGHRPGPGNENNRSWV